MLDQMFTDNAIFFSIPAVFGTGVFILRMAMLLMGADDGGDMTADVGDVDFGHGGHDGGLIADSEPIDHAGTNPDSAFRIISIQTIAAFLMGAGWGGLGAHLGSGIEFGWSALIAFGCGMAMLYIFAWMMKFVYDMQTTGNIPSSMVVGKDALVDVSVPSSRGGQGTVKIIIDDRMRRYRAITEGPTLDRGAAVQIIKLNPDNTVTVTRA